MFAAVVEIPVKPVRQPWIMAPYSLISWWDMENFAAAEFFSIAVQLSALVNHSERDQEAGIRTAIFPEQKEVFLRALRAIEGNCTKLGLKVSTHATRHAIRAVENPITMFSEMAPIVEQVRNNIQWEMLAVQFFHMPSKQADFYDKKELFGAVVNAKFPSIQYDMVEAGNCFSITLEEAENLIGQVRLFMGQLATIV